MKQEKSLGTYDCDEKDVANYTCYRINELLEINGDLTKPVLERCNKSPRFVDMVTGEPGIYDTRVA